MVMNILFHMFSTCYQQLLTYVVRAIFKRCASSFLIRL